MEKIIRELADANPYKLVLSGGRDEYRKVIFSRRTIGGRSVFQIERHADTQVFHENIDVNNLYDVLTGLSDKNFRQINSFSADMEYDVKISKKGKYTVNRRKVEGRKIEISGNNRKKKYILEEGMDIPVFKELGIFTKEGKIVNSMYDKYKQINRFVEMTDDILKNYKKSSIRIIDFGCGKSYLTFILYYYLVEIKKIDAHITGLDLKEKVINDCNVLARKFGYNNLNFELGDINGYKADGHVDMVVTLHACDVATDYALYNAVCWKADYILSVPCCQHEVNSQISSDRLSALMKYGIIKERTSALITDAIRGCVLESCGYKTDLLEFIDIEHSPKNILIRAVKKNISDEKRQRSYEEADRLCDEFGLDQTLIKMIRGE